MTGPSTVPPTAGLSAAQVRDLVAEIDKLGAKLSDLPAHCAELVRLREENAELTGRVDRVLALCGEMSTLGYQYATAGSGWIANLVRSAILGDRNAERDDDESCEHCPRCDRPGTYRDSDLCVFCTVADGEERRDELVTELRRLTATVEQLPARIASALNQTATMAARGGRSDLAWPERRPAGVERRSGDHQAQGRVPGRDDFPSPAGDTTTTTE